MRTSKGFTLIELMITIAVIAILAAIALPSYSDYVIRGKLADAAQALSDQRLKMEQYFQDNRTYVGACQPNTVAPPPGQTAYFVLTCTPAPTATRYTVSASGKPGTNVALFTFTIDEANNRVTAAVPPGWNTSANCWIRSRDGTC